MEILNENLKNHGEELIEFLLEKKSSISNSQNMYFSMYKFNAKFI